MLFIIIKNKLKYFTIEVFKLYIDKKYNLIYK